MRILPWLVVLLLPAQLHAAVFNPQNIAELHDAVRDAGRNQQRDIIDLGGQRFLLDKQLIIKPDAGFGLTLTNGIIERPDDAAAFRLVWIQPLSVRSIISNNDMVEIINVVFRNGYVDATRQTRNTTGGGAIMTQRPTYIGKSEFLNNRLKGNGSGGAVLATEVLEVSRSLFINNLATPQRSDQAAQGGAISIKMDGGLYSSHNYFLGNSADEGGAIYVSRGAYVLNITRSTFDSNHASITGGAVWSNVRQSTVRVSNSTFYDNDAPLGGGAIYSQSSQINVMLSHLTVWGNRSNPNRGGGLKLLFPRQHNNTSLKNSIVGNNTGGDCASIAGEMQFGEVMNNLVSDGSCGSVGVEVLKNSKTLFAGTLSYEGGLVPSLPIGANSEAVNLVPVEQCIGFDTRDRIRPDAGSATAQFCDAGAYEYIPNLRDSDKDGIADALDNCKQQPNALQSDIDKDGAGDACDELDNRDSDKDFIANYLDNCPMVSNFAQTDRNGNSIGDACDR